MVDDASSGAPGRIRQREDGEEGHESQGRAAGARGGRRHRSVGVPAGGTTATGVANLATSGNDQHQNLFWARQTLAGQTLRVQVGEE